MACCLTAAGFRYTTAAEERTAHDDVMSALAPVLLTVDGAQFYWGVLSKLAADLLGKSSRHSVIDAVTGVRKYLTMYSVTRSSASGSSTSCSAMAAQ